MSNIAVIAGMIISIFIFFKMYSGVVAMMMMYAMFE